ncbi:hypothetical protein BH23ACT9_BH23ACT9_12340 [soil metagenome]
MPVVESSVVVPLDAATAFAVSQTTGEVRLRWDPFIRRQWFTDGSVHPGKGVRTRTRHRLGFVMDSEYVSWNPPRNVGMRMLGGPPFFASFAGGWQFRPVDGDLASTTAIWRYSFTIRPPWLRPIADRIGVWVLGRDLRRRIAGYAAGCVDPVVVVAARADMAARGEDGESGPASEA